MASLHLPIDSESFERLVDHHRDEIRLHCYRMLGSIDDAEDAAQEAFAGAWRGRDTFEGRSSPRTWLYRIATNACLRALERRGTDRRVLPDALGPHRPVAPLAEPDRETLWLEPYPDAGLAAIRDDGPGPETRVAAKEAVRLAFIATIQELPRRQRAILLLRDVVGLSAKETATALGMSETAANSGLQRARIKLKGRFPDGPPRGPVVLESVHHRLLEAFVRTWEAGDIDGFVALLARDATWTMPPWRQWFVGRDAIGEFLRWAWRMTAPGQRLVPTSANGQPAFGYYRRSGDGAGLSPFAIQVIGLDRAEIRSITNFVDPRLFEAFGLPARLPHDDR